MLFLARSNNINKIIATTKGILGTFINIEINSPILFKTLVIDNKILNIGLKIGNIKVIIEIDKNYAKSILITTSEMIADDQGLIFDAFIFTAANYVAQASINKEFSVIIGSKCFFYAPLKLGDVLELEAHALFDETSKKRDVKVVGHVKEVKMFEGTIQVVSTDEHIFKLKRPPLNTVKPTENQEQGAKINNPEAVAAALMASVGGK